jgi:hypothetical protein
LAYFFFLGSWLPPGSIPGGIAGPTSPLEGSVGGGGGAMSTSGAGFGSEIPSLEARVEEKSPDATGPVCDSGGRSW